MERIRKALLRNSGVLVTDFDGTLTVSGSSLHAAVHVLGADSGLARGRDALYCSMGREILDAGSAAAVSEELKARAERWWKKQMELYVELQIPEKVLEEAAIPEAQGGGRRASALLRGQRSARVDCVCGFRKCHPFLA